MTTRTRVRWSALIALALAVTACTESTVYVNEPQPAAVAGYVALEFTRAAPPQFSALSLDASEDISASVWNGPMVDSGVQLQPTGNIGLFRVGDRIYLHAEFELRNDTDAALTNVVLLGYHREEFRAGSAISQPYRASGGVPPDLVVQQIKPTHRLDLDPLRIGSPDALTGRTLMSDFVAFAEDELPTLDDDFLVTVFPYGFAIGNGSPIAPGESARVHVGFTYPDAASAASALARFTWNAVILTTDDVRVTQAPDENHARGWAAVLERADRFAANRIVAIGPGTRSVTDPTLCEALVGLANVRTAGVDTSDDAYVGLVPTPGAPQFAGCEGATP